ncbi:polyphosphate glucokinase [Arcanobacterium wilhelmae]|uniref:Polyphosphate glucokinase n=1 Tax=Arcanobacterium wilhelmae TaxID=1803177 RepID=A0ABT9NCG9_9ACTO|nr:ROK family protein [Arcanobacterium wilhelmae]MDP9801413.1 polyphosphate glucokinase [Arcanobacterium wilhelmae]WFN90748.1 ROK family protein [Arcanobacterium wilhelmae]
MTEVSHERTLTVDCGGGGVKSALLDAGGFQLGDSLRTPVPYPFSPQDLADIITKHADALGQFTRMTVGLPGMIRHGVVVYTPHYIRRSGPHTRPLPQLEEAWNGLDLQTALEVRFGVPSLVLNDAEVAAAGVVRGRGLELVMTLGTGLGTAFLDNGHLAPHLEISHAQMKWGLTYDDVVGEAERLRLGDSAWSRRVLKAIETLYPVFRWDQLYIGGGNASRITDSVRARLTPAIFVPNMAGTQGGVRAWAMAKPHPTTVLSTE